MAGTYCPPFAGNALLCPSNSASSNAATTCICNGGYEASGSGVTLVCNGPYRHALNPCNAFSRAIARVLGAGSIACSAGSYSGGGGAACTPCPSGSNSSAAATSCLCLPGFQVDALGTGCTGTRMINRIECTGTHGVDELLGVRVGCRVDSLPGWLLQSRRRPLHS